MEEERVKSALELAMERISSLPELTPQDILEQKEKRYRPIGEAMAVRYLDGAVREDELLYELGKYEAEPHRIIRRSLLTRLCRAVEIDGDGAAAERALEAIDRIVTGKRSLIENAAEEFRSIRSRFEQEKEQKSAGIRPEAAERLGISGSAVRWNLAEYKPWTEELERLRKAYEPKLAAVRDRLREAL